jgi:N6-adenosine-specific RNA methylase IME4
MPKPGTDLVPEGWCEQVLMPWADEQYEEVAVQQAVAQLAGLEAAYSTLGSDTLELTKSRRYLEVRWGELLGNGQRGNPTGANQYEGGNSHASEIPLSKDDRLRFRQMAAAKTDIVEFILAATDTDELARSRLLKATKQTHSPALPRTNAQGAYGALVVDPPWRYGNAATRGAAEDHYRTMPLSELFKLPDICPPLAESVNSHLYLWTTAGMLLEAFDVLHAWGYTYKTNLVWVKPQIGMGNYFRVSHEHVLFGVRGNAGRTQDKALRSWFEAPRERHSRKPLAFYDLVEKASPGPYVDVVDVFARDRRFGWDVWGNEA